jgi:nitrite reductase (NO-forming)
MEMHDRPTIGGALAISAVLLLSLALSAVPAQAQEAEMKLSVVIYGRGNPDGTFFFSMSEILVGAPGVLVNVTFINDDTVNNVNHDFTIELDGVVYQTPLLSVGEVGYVEFYLNETGTFPYWCSVPGHRQLGMEGAFVVGLVSPEEGPEVAQGLPLRAYWIGLIGIFSMIAVIIAAYFVIKYESRHHTDHREHKRRGLP